MIGFALAGPEKMAIVGDDKWQDDAFAFTAKGFRATAIEFFTPSRLNEATHVAEFLDDIGPKSNTKASRFSLVSNRVN